jgi:hypothetical protein
VTGPLFVEDAEPGDALSIEVRLLICFHDSNAAEGGACGPLQPPLRARRVRR